MLSLLCLTIPEEQYPAYSVGFHVVWNKRFGNAAGVTPPWLAHFLGGPSRATPPTRNIQIGAPAGSPLMYDLLQWRG